MTRVTVRRAVWVATATLPVLLWACTNNVRSIDDGPPGTMLSNGTGGGGSGVGPLLGTGGASSCSGNGMGGRGVFMTVLDGPQDVGTIEADVAPPAISGGTLLVLADGVTAVAADPDRDRIYVIDIPSGALTATVALMAGDQPGRLAEDGTGQVHVALRGGGAIATIDPAAGMITMRRTACTTPRGIAYDGSRGLLYLACASGDLMVFTPTGATPSMTWSLDQDLRDVVVDGDGLLVTRFRSAEVLEVDATTGAITNRQRPPTFSNRAVRDAAAFEPVVAWRAVPLPGGGMVMAHQRGMYNKVTPSPGGYGTSGGDPCGTIVHSCISKMKRGGQADAGPAFPAFVLPVDVAVSPAGDKVAVVAAGNGHAPPTLARRLFIGGTDDVTQESPDNGCGMDDKHGPAPSGNCFPGSGGVDGTGTTMDPGSGGVSGQMATGSGGVGGATTRIKGSGGTMGPVAGFCGPDPVDDGEPVAVAFAGDDTVLVQIREPAELLVLRGLKNSTAQKTVVPLSSVSRADTGHALFHANSSGGLACASCHPEGHDDGRVWDFDCEGPRRTQDPSGGLAGTAPFHWSGDLPNFSALVDEVYVRRMSGPALGTQQTTELQDWVDKLPELPPQRATGDSQVARGKALFESPSVGCASCHTGAAYTNNMTVDVGTGASFQVPALHGVGWRAPYMHDGCAPTLSDRFTNPTCGGGDRHGVTSQLSDGDRADLIAYLQSL